MDSWDVEPYEDKDAPYFFRNASRTPLTFSKRVDVDLPALLVRMEERGVPFRYTEGLKEVRFSVSRFAGSYLQGNVVLHAGSRLGIAWGFTEELCRNFVHELGHHIDDQEAISDDPQVLKEKRTKARYMPDPYAKKNAAEYVAVGFEIFYFGTKGERAMMRKRNPRLYKRIMHAHRKYGQK